MSLGGGVGGVVGKIMPLVRVFGYFIEFFAAFTIVNVMKTFRAYGMIRAKPVRRVRDHCRVRPLGLWIAYQRDDAPSFVLRVFR